MATNSLSRINTILDMNKAIAYLINSDLIFDSLRNETGKYQLDGKNKNFINSTSERVKSHLTYIKNKLAPGAYDKMRLDILSDDGALQMESVQTLFTALNSNYRDFIEDILQQIFKANVASDEAKAWHIVQRLKMFEALDAFPNKDIEDVMHIIEDYLGGVKNPRIAEINIRQAQGLAAEDVANRVGLEADKVVQMFEDETMPEILLNLFLKSRDKFLETLNNYAN